MEAIKPLFNLRWLTVIVALAFCLGIEEARAESVLYGVAHIGKTGPTSTFYTIDRVTGMATPVGPITVNLEGTPTNVLKVSGMDADPSGRLYATGEVDGIHVLITIDPTTGEGTMVGPTGIGSRDIPYLKTATDISFSFGGTMYANFARPPLGASKPRAEFLGTINPLTGTATVLGETVVQQGAAIAFSEDDTLYKAGNSDLYTLDLSTGNGTSVAQLVFVSLQGGLPRLNAMDVEPETGTLFASLNNKPRSGEPENYLTTVDVTTGEVTLIGQTVPGLDALAFVPVVTATANLGLPYMKCKKVARGRYIRKHEKVEVMLNDGTESIKVRVMNPVSLCTPVGYNGEELADSASSMTCYRVKDVMRHRRSRHHRNFEWHHVYIENEYGEQTLSMSQPETLCVPTEITDDKVKIKTYYHKKHKGHSKKHKRDDDDDDN